MREFALQGLKGDSEHERHVGFPANEAFHEKMENFLHFLRANEMQK